MSILLASEVMDLSASALNDTDKTVYTYDNQLNYLKMALQELQEIFALNSLPVTEQFSQVIRIQAGQSEIRFNVTNAPRLPDNLIEIQRLWEGSTNSNPFIPMSRRDSIPQSFGALTNQFVIWAWQDNKVVLVPANADNYIKIEYIGSLFPKFVNEHTILPTQNALGFLSYRTGGLIADLVEHNDARAEKLNNFASLALDRISGITIKGKQIIMARRRPFRAGYKSQGWS